ncbi:hypothetical protein [Haladaptatus salinisoli]|uniref:hypothetical protein n=1 Tax=Haladaptatus salinisoli TaxID=2884876 RepID=UPI001D0B6D41|nr:hypothetical protein [Haladaptatus salinisoli]
MPDTTPTDAVVEDILTLDSLSNHGSRADCLLALAYIEHEKSGRDRPFPEQARITSSHLERKNIPQQIRDRQEE